MKPEDALRRIVDDHTERRIGNGKLPPLPTCRNCANAVRAEGYELCGSCFESEARRAQQQMGFDRPSAFDRNGE